MNKLMLTFAALTFALASVLGSNALAGSSFAGEKFHNVCFYKSGGAGSLSGADAGNAKAMTDSDCMAIEAGMIIEKVYVVITTGITGVTNLDVGDDDDADGFVDGSLSIADLAVTGMYGWNSKVAGAYLRVQTAGATDALDIDVVSSAKYYAAAGKEVKVDFTTASTAGAFQVHVEGYKVKQ